MALSVLGSAIASSPTCRRGVVFAYLTVRILCDLSVGSCAEAVFFRVIWFLLGLQRELCTVPHVFCEYGFECPARGELGGVWYTRRQMCVYLSCAATSYSDHGIRDPLSGDYLTVL